MRRKSTSYASILRRNQFDVRLNYPWASVGTPKRKQGWKLHLSTVVAEAPRLLHTVLPALKASRADFKVILSSDLLINLNEGLLGETQVGKFATIYPRSDMAARSLAGCLIERTRGFHGPIVQTDLRLGEVVYSRYGGFNPSIVRDRLGSHSAYLRSAAGRLEPDSYTVPYSIPHGRRHPFGDLASSNQQTNELVLDPCSATSLIGPGYLVLEVIKAHPKGSVYRGLDLRKPKSMSICVLKQGRPWCLADFEGRDIRTRLRHQVQVHSELEGRAPIPRADPYFEVDGHGFVPFEFIQGRTLGLEVLTVLKGWTWWSLPPSRRLRLLRGVMSAIDAVQCMHDAGYVHRDLNAGNLLVGASGNVHLIDLEIAHRLDDRSIAFDAGTPGFVSPQQRARHRPSTSDDVYAVGAILLMTISGLDPRRPQFASSPDRARQWSTLVSGDDAALARMAARCLDERAAHRPQLREMRHLVQACIDSYPNGAAAAIDLEAKVQPAAVSSRNGSTARTTKTGAPSRAVSRAAVERAIQQGLRGLLHRDHPQANGLWLSKSFESDHAANGAAGGRFELRRSTNRGVAGVLYVLGRLARFGHRSPASTARARRAAAWLLDGQQSPDSNMPGLHFGEAGVAVAISEAIAGGLIPSVRRVNEFIARGLRGRLDWPDITHGAAGQGVAALICADRLGDESLARLATPCVDYLLKSQHPAGHWSWPSGRTSKSKGTWTGFAHGVAGIAYFLAEYARRFNDDRSDQSWRRAVQWLLRHAKRKGATMWWPNKTGSPERWSWWCHGSVGISLLFLRLHEWTGDAKYADVAKRALSAHPPAFIAENLSQCHGMAGVGDIYVEAARVLDDRRWYERATTLWRTLWSLRRASGGGASWLVEGVDAPTADLMVGSSGILHFALRLSRPKAMGPPLLLDPVADQ